MIEAQALSRTGWNWKVSLASSFMSLRFKFFICKMGIHSVL